MTHIDTRLWCNCRSTTLILTDSSQQHLDQLLCHFCTTIHGPQRMKPDDSDDPMTFHAAPPAADVSPHLLKYLNI